MVTTIEANTTRSLNTVDSEFFDYEVKLSTSFLDAHQLKEFADAQMPKTGVGTVPWSTPLSSDQLIELAAKGKAEFITARMMLASVPELPLLGIGALIRDPDNYPTPRMIIVVESEFRQQGLGLRIAKELLRRLSPGEAVQAEVQRGLKTPRRTAYFFERLGFQCVEENYRTGNVPEYVDGILSGMVERNFSLHEFTKSTEIQAAASSFQQQLTN